MGLSRHGPRFPSTVAILQFAACDFVIVTVSVVTTAVVLSVAIDSIQRLSAYGYAVALRTLGAILGSAVGVAMFSGSGIARSGLRPWLVAFSVISGLALGAWVSRQTTAIQTVFQHHPVRLHLVALCIAVGSYAAHAYVFVRLYPGIHALLALTTVITAIVAADRPTVGGWSRRRANTVLLWTILGLLGTRTVERSQTLRALVRQTAPLGGYPVALLGRLTRKRGAVAIALDTPSVAGPHLPLAGMDIVLVTVDALRADRLRINGGVGRMPTLDAIAADGTVFRHAYCTTPHTSYSIASLMLGKFSQSVLALPVVQPQETLAQRVGAMGYATAGFYPPAVFSVDAERFGDLRARGFDFSFRREGYADAPDRVREVSDWLVTQPPTERVFVWVHLFEPHEPYVSHPEHPYGDSAIQRYDAEVSAADDALASLRRTFAHAHRSPAWIITADHGEEFGEHGGSFHGTSLYDEQVRVPLVMSVVGVPHHVVDDPVSLVDVTPTLLAGLGAAPMPRHRGGDIGPLAWGQELSTRAYASTGTLRMVVEGATKLILDLADGGAELYDLADDPTERNNLADAQPAVVARLRDAIQSWEASHARYEARSLSASPTGVSTLDAGLVTDEDLPDVLNRAVQGDRSVADQIADLLQAALPSTRVRAAVVLGDLGVRSARVTDALAAAMRTADPEISREAGLSLALLGDVRGISVAHAALASPHPALARRAALGLARLGDVSSVTVLGAWLHDPGTRESVRDDVANALRRLRAPAARIIWQSLLGDLHLAPLAATSLGELGDARAIPSLESLVATPTYPLTVRAAAEALVVLGAPDARRRMAEAIIVTDPLPNVFPLLRRVDEPGHLVAGTSRSVRLGPREVVLPLHPTGALQRLYIRTRSIEACTVTIAPYDVDIPVPAGEHEEAVAVDRQRVVGTIHVHATGDVTLIGVAGH